MKRKRIVYAISNVSKSLGLEWTLFELKKKYDISVLLYNPSDTSFQKYLSENNIPVTRIHYTGKKDIPTAFIRTFLRLLTQRPDIIHTHLFDATLIGLYAGKLAGVKKRIYTRHHSTYHHQYFPNAVKYDRWCNHAATDIISISRATYRTLTEKEGVKEKKIIDVPHGFDLHTFSNVNETDISFVKSKWNIIDNVPVIGIIARHIEWKGVQYIVPAFQKLLINYPSAILILANANGPYHNQIMQLLSDIPRANYRIIPFEENVAALYKTFNIYIHTPIDPLSEAFGQTYIEALASKIPSIFTLSGIASEFIEHEKNALVVDYCNSKEIYEALTRLRQDKQLSNTLSSNGFRSVQRFKLSQMINDLEKTYDK